VGGWLIGFSFIPVVIPLMVLVPILAVVKIVQFIYFAVSRPFRKALVALFLFGVTRTC